MHLTGLDLLLWAASFLGHVALLSVLWVRGRVRLFPIFTAFITLNVIRTVALFFIQRYGTAIHYFYSFWSLAIVDVAFQLGVVYELGSYIFRPNGQWIVGLRRHLALWIVSSFTIASGISWVATPETKVWVQTLVIKGSVFSAALLSELFVGMIVLSATARLPWDTHVTRISQGLGVYSIVTLVLETARTYFGVAKNGQTYSQLSHLRIAVYLACLLYWIVTLWRNNPTGRQMPDLMRRQLAELNEDALHHLRILQSEREP
jgi:hypothetical protein